MGKSKNRRHRAPKSCPTGLPSVKDIEKEEEECGPMENDHDQVPGTVQSLTEKLQSSRVEEKECACLTIANLASQEEAMQHLLNHSLVRTLAPLLVDPSSVVKHAAVSALRSISSAGGAEACDKLQDEDVMTPLVKLLNEFSLSWQPTPSKEENSIDTRTETFVEAVELLWNLCESSPQAVTVFNREGLLDVLSNAVCVETYGRRVVTTVAQCLHTVTEDNPEAEMNLIDSPLYQQLMKLISLDHQDDCLLRVLSAGVILNLHGGKLASCTSSTIAVIIKCLADILTVNTDIHSYSTLDKGEAQERPADELETVISAQQVALELLANICCNDDGSDEWNDVDSSDTSDEILIRDVSLDGDDVCVDKFSGDVACEVHEAIISHKLIDSVLAKIKAVDAETIERLKKLPKGNQLAKKLSTLQCRALCCLQNLVLCLDVEDFNGPTSLYSLWVQLGQHTLQFAADGNIDLVDAATGGMRSVVQKLANTKSSAHFDQMSPADLQLLHDLYGRCHDPNIHVNIISIMGTLGAVLWASNNPSGKDLVKGIGQFLLEVVTNASQVWVIAEALDAIFDVFAEDELEGVALDIGLLNKLKGLLPGLKQKINASKKTLGEHYPVVMTAKTNLLRFIKYKTDYGSQHSATNGHSAVKRNISHVE